MHRDNVSDNNRAKSYEVMKGENARKTAYGAGSGSAIGTAIGMIFGLLLFENLAWGCVIGAAVGLVMGAAVDTQLGRHCGDTNDQIEGRYQALCPGCSDYRHPLGCAAFAPRRCGGNRSTVG